MKLLLLLTLLLPGTALHAQQKGTPGQFDFYLLNLVPAAEFCKIKDVGPHCVPPRYGIVGHGLWPQNNDGTYPVFCDTRSGPRNPNKYLTLTPNLALLDHEWQKHGTCTSLDADAFFHLGEEALKSFKMPASFEHQKPGLALKPEEVIQLVLKANPGFPEGSVVVWCSEHRFTSVSACFSKDLHPIACQGLKSCADESIVMAPPRVN